MGLIQGRIRRPAVGVAQLRFWVFPVAIVMIAAVFGAAGEAGILALRYDRPALGDGEFWRLLTAHFVHLGWPHFGLNAAGIALVWILVGDYLDLRRWLGTSLIVIAGIDVCFWFLSPSLVWYVGASGLLHGLLVAGLLAGLRRAPVESSLVLVVVLAKLGYEQVAGPLPGSESAAGGPVVVDSHLYGAIAGAAAAAFNAIRVPARPAI